MEPEKISDEDYAHAKELWDAFECKNLADYTKTYCKIDTLQLADVFEGFIGVCLEKYKLDPAYYLTSGILPHVRRPCLGRHVEGDGGGNRTSDGS